MKKVILFILFVTLAFFGYGQEETPAVDINFDGKENTKSLDGFLIDVPLLTPQKMPELYLKKYNPASMRKLQFTDQSFMIYPVNSSMMYHSMMLSSPYTFMNDFFSPPLNLLMGSFKLTDNIRLNTYGQYTLDGKKLPDLTGHPWNKRNFTGGAELKFNKNFGIRLDVRYNNNPLFPY